MNKRLATAGFVAILALWASLAPAQFIGESLFARVKSSAPPTVTAVSPTFGTTSGGTSVTLTGTNFTGFTAVDFGSGNAATCSGSSTSLSCTSPSGSAGVINVTVTTPAGTSATGSANQYTYVGVPNVTAVSPHYGVTAGGTAVVITGTNFLGSTVVDFGASNPASFIVTNNTTITVASTPAGSNATIDVTVTNPEGTSSTGAADEFSYTNYTGAVDVAGAALTYWGVRAPSVAYAASLGKLANICTPSDATCADVDSDLNGNLNLTASGLGCNNTTVICTIKTKYDTSGSLLCGSAPCDVTNTTIADRPILVTSCNGSLPCMTLPKTAGLANATGFAHSQQFSWFGGTRRNGTSGFSYIYAQPSSMSAAFYSFGASANQLIGTSDNFTDECTNSSVADNTFHATGMQFDGNGSASHNSINGTFVACNAGTGSLTAGALFFGSASSAQTVSLVDFGIWAGGFSSTTFTNLSANERGYWGF